MCSADIFLAFLAILFPPLPVWVKRGLCSADSLINLLLFSLCYVPGLIHAWYIIAKYPELPYEYEALPQESGHVTHVYVQYLPGGQHHNPQTQSSQQQPKPQPQPCSAANINYGTQGVGTSGQVQQPVVAAGEGSSDHQGVPPSYAEVVAEDHKIQTKD